MLSMLLRLLLLPRFAAVFHPLSSGNARIWARFTHQEIDTWSQNPNPKPAARKSRT